VIDDSEATGIVADFIAEALDSRDPLRQKAALTISEQLAWRAKSLDGHRDFVWDCGGLLVDDDLALQSMLRITWKLRFWESLEDMLRAFLSQVEFDLIPDDYGKVIFEIRSSDTTEMYYLSQLSPFIKLIEEQFQEFSGFPVSVKLRLLESGCS
jgi:hypothetical protein